MAEMADLVDAANVAAVQTAQTGDQAPSVSKAAPTTMAVPIPVDDTPTEPATSPRMIDLKWENGQLNFNFQHERLVLVQNLKSILVDSWWMMVNGRPKSM